MIDNFTKKIWKIEKLKFLHDYKNIHLKSYLLAKDKTTYNSTWIIR